MLKSEISEKIISGLEKKYIYQSLNKLSDLYLDNSLEYIKVSRELVSSNIQQYFY